MTIPAAFVHGGEYFDYSNIKLDFSVNTNPLGMPGNVSYALTTHVAELEKYPDRSCTQLKSAISSKYQNFDLSPDNIFIGNGASEVITLLAGAISPKRALIIEPTFSGYERALKSTGAKIIRYMLLRADNFELEYSFLAYLRAAAPDVLFACSPNNPTGRCIKPDLVKKIADICEELGIYFVLDECFMGFAKGHDNSSCMRLLSKHPHLILLSAFTKLYCMPGVRLGYCICKNTNLIKNLEDIQPEWSISAYAQLAGITALSEDEYLQRTLSIINSERDFLTERLKKSGMTVFPGDANFLLFNMPSRLKKGNLQAYLAERHGILIRSCDSFNGLDHGDFRIAVRTHDENLALLEAINKYLS